MRYAHSSKAFVEEKANKFTCISCCIACLAASRAMLEECLLTVSVKSKDMTLLLMRKSLGWENARQISTDESYSTGAPANVGKSFASAHLQF